MLAEEKKMEAAKQARSGPLVRGTPLNMSTRPDWSSITTARPRSAFASDGHSIPMQGFSVWLTVKNKGFQASVCRLIR